MTDESSPADDGSDVEANTGISRLTDRDTQFFKLLATEGGREILAALTTDRSTIPQIIDQCSVSRATVYRYIDDLRQTGLIEEESTISETGGRRTLVRLAVTNADVSFGSTALRVSYLPTDPAARLEWLLNAFEEIATDPHDTRREAEQSEEE